MKILLKPHGFTSSSLQVSYIKNKSKDKKDTPENSRMDFGNIIVIHN